MISTALLIKGESKGDRKVQKAKQRARNKADLLLGRVEQETHEAGLTLTPHCPS